MIFAFLVLALALVEGNEETTTSRYERCNVDVWLGYFEIYPKELLEAHYALTDELLDNGCPDLQRMKKNFEDYLEDCLKPGDAVFPFYAYDGKYIEELCNKNSVIRANYVRHAECYRGLENAFKRCEDNATGQYERYRESGGHIDSTYSDYQRMCIRSAFSYVCDATEIAATCGEQAYRDFFELGKLRDSTKGIRYFCSAYDFERELNTGFFAQLQINENQRQEYNEVLDYLKTPFVWEFFKQ
uniref:BLTX135 n=2 Tax=Nephila pilipes TaxID=299642 RepID=A0A076L1U8_NEPPI|nr:BLTX135 [Nephila pilipes]